MRVYKVKVFARFQRKENLADAALAEAIRRAEAGLVDTDLGGGLLKLRVARRGEGKRGGYRTIVAYRRDQRAVFLFGFAKNNMDNLDEDELVSLRQLGRMWLRVDDDTIAIAMDDGKVMEVDYDSDNPNLSQPDR